MILATPDCALADTNTKRQTGREAQLQNIESAKAVADIVRWGWFVLDVIHFAHTQQPLITEHVWVLALC